MIEEEKRTCILVMELAGLFHDIGKFTDGFVDYQQRKAYIITPNPPYFYKLISDPKIIIVNKNHTLFKTGILKKYIDFSNSNPPSGAPYLVKGLDFKPLENQKFTVGKEDYSIAELVILGEQRYIKDAPDMAGATGKSMRPALLLGQIHGVAHYEKPGVQSQTRDIRYLSNPFGFERKIGNFNALCGKIPFKDLDQFHTLNYRNSWLEKVKNTLIKGFADTSLPLNEVSLWDWGYMVASLTKAAVSADLRSGSNAITFTKKDLSWQTLSVNYDELEILMRAEKISDLLGLVKELDTAAGQLKGFLEFTQALGNEIYRDETGLYFLVSKLGNIDESLRSAIQEAYPPDLRPLVHLGEEVMATSLDPDGNDAGKSIKRREASKKLLAEPRRKAVDALRHPVKSNENNYDWERLWENNSDKEICTVCGIRPVGSKPDEEENEAWVNAEKAESRKICQECLARRGRPAQDWQEGERKTTIWLDEVADANGRLALLVGRFTLDGWVDGRLLETLRFKNAAAVADDYYKYPTPAAIGRVLRALQEFWSVSAPSLINEGETVPKKKFRLEIKAVNPDAVSKKLGKFPHSYTLKCGGLQAAAVWTGKHLLLVENLDYLAKREGLSLITRDSPLLDWQDKFINKTCQLLAESRPPVNQVGSDALELEFTCAQIELLKDEYSPCITLLEKPSLYYLLLPAQSALQLVKEIKEQYEMEFGKARDKLPLSLGLVFFPRRIPMRAVLAAGRAMLAQPVDWQDMKIVSVDKKFSGNNQATVNRICEYVRLTFSDGISWEIPTLMGDGQTEDKWYPWLRLPGEHNNGIVNTVLAQEIIEGTTILARPSLFDFEFLDTSGRRHDIAYDPKNRRVGVERRPYRLEELDEMQFTWDKVNCLALTQLNELMQVTEEKRGAWRKETEADPAVFKNFIKDALWQLNWPEGWQPSIEEMGRLEKAGVSGLLYDTLVLRLKILKEKES